jgi:hypothetical protein
MKKGDLPFTLGWCLGTPHPYQTAHSDKPCPFGMTRIVLMGKSEWQHLPEQSRRVTVGYMRQCDFQDMNDLNNNL